MLQGPVENLDYMDEERENFSREIHTIGRSQMETLGIKLQ